MAYNYKRYSHKQLLAEKQDIKEKLQKAIEENDEKRIKVYQRKIEVVRSFMLDPSEFQPKDIRFLKDDQTHYFGILRINGVMAWGYRLDKQTLKKQGEKEVILLDALGAIVENWQDIVQGRT